MLVYPMFLLIATSTVADVVVPSERVRNSVTVRENQSSNSDPIGSLTSGEDLEWIRNVGK